MAAYENREVTWEEMLATNQRLDPKLELPPDGPLTTRGKVTEGVRGDEGTVTLYLPSETPCNYVQSLGIVVTVG